MKRRIVREFLEGIALGAVVSSMLLVSAGASAAGRTGIPERRAWRRAETGQARNICPELPEGKRGK